MGELTMFKISEENDEYLMELYDKLGGGPKFNEISEAGKIELTIHGFGDILITLLLNELDERG